MIVMKDYTTRTKSEHREAVLGRVTCTPTHRLQIFRNSMQQTAQHVAYYK